jgi:hypothetical protein
MNRAVICVILVSIAASIVIGLHLGRERIECESRGGVLVRGTGDGLRCAEPRP